MQRTWSTRSSFLNEGLLNCTFYDEYSLKIQRRLTCLVTNTSIGGENNETNKTVNEP